MKLVRREPEPVPHADEVSERLIAAARACHAWTELPRSELVERDRGYFVHADTDAVYLAYRGDAFSPSGAVVADQTPLYFVVDENGLHVLERQPESWSQIVYARERAKAATR